MNCKNYHPKSIIKCSCPDRVSETMIVDPKCPIHATPKPNGWEEFNSKFGELNGVREVVEKMLVIEIEEVKNKMMNKFTNIVNEAELNLTCGLGRQGLGCGVEDRGITDRYEAVDYGVEQTIFSIRELLDQFSQSINLKSNLKQNG